MKMVYQWKQDGRIKLPAQVVGDRLENLRKKHGSLTPGLVVADAADENSPLHPAFDWNDRSAAKKWREEQAKLMIRMLVIQASEDEDDETTVRAFVSVVQDDDRQYTSMKVAMADPDLREQVIQQCFDELTEARNKYKHLREFAKVWEAVDSVAV